MSRVQVNIAAGWLAREAALPRSPLVGSDSSGAGLFDQHLEQAQKLAAAPSDARPEPSSGAAVPGPSQSPAREDPGQSPSDDLASADNAAESLPSQAVAGSSEDADSGHEPQPSVDDRHDADQDADQASDAASAAGASATGAEAAQTQADNAPPHGRSEQSAGRVESTRAGSRLAATQATGKSRSGMGDHGTADPASAKTQPVETVAASQTAVDAAANSVGEIVQTESSGVAEEIVLGKSDQTQQSAVSTDQLPATSPGVAASSAANAQAEPTAASVQTDSSVSASSPKDAAEGQATESGVRRTGSRPSARLASQPDAPQQELQTATASEIAPPDATVRPVDSGTAHADLPAPDSELKAAASHDATDPSGAKATDLSASRNASAQASDAAGHRSDEAAKNDAADRARFVQRIARAFESAADRGGHVRLRLYPPELGSLRLDLTIRNGLLNARLETETESARNMLLENLPALKERLAGHHIQVERFDIEWRGQSQGGLPQRSGDHDRWQPPSPGRAGRVTGVARGGSGPDAAGAAARRLNPGTSFDVVI